LRASIRDYFIDSDKTMQTRKKKKKKKNKKKEKASATIETIGKKYGPFLG